MGHRLAAEAIGTFWLVLGGAGSAVLAATFPDLGIGFLGVSLAFGLTVLTMAYAVGHISGGHFNPAVSLGLWAAGQFRARDLLPYVAAQVIGGVLGGSLLYLIASGKAGFDPATSFACNGFGEHSPGGFSLRSGFVAETAMTFLFLLIILGCTDKRAPAGFAPLVIGAALTLIHLITIPVTNTSVNPARSTGVAVFAGGWAIESALAVLVGAHAGGLPGRPVPPAPVRGGGGREDGCAAGRRAAVGVTLAPYP